MALHDLSHRLETGVQTYPGDPSVAVEPHTVYEDDGHRVSALELGTHSGTHVDAPSHTEADGKTLGEFPLETFRFDAHVVDLRELGPRAAVGVDPLPEPTDGDDLLVLHTGRDDDWGTAAYLDHPYLTEAAAEWCVDHGYHVATDALNVDPTPSPNARPGEPAGFPAHHVLLGADRLILENLTGLDAVPARFELHAYPLAIDRDGAPVRAVAVVPE